jgi:hypothetical protein
MANLCNYGILPLVFQDPEDYKPSARSGCHGNAGRQRGDGDAREVDGKGIKV